MQARAGRLAAPGPDDPERLALPLHLGPAVAALFDRLPARLPPAATERAVTAIEQGRARLAEVAPPGIELVVDAYRVRLAAACPASAAGGGAAFQWSPPTAARHLGLRALAIHLCGERPQPVERAVETVVAEQMAKGGERTPGPWLASLDPPGRAVAQAQAQRWAEQAVAWLPLRLVDRRSLHFLGDDWWSAGARHRERGAGAATLVLHGRRDLTVDLAGRRVAVTLAGGTAVSPGAADADALTALTAGLCDPRGRVVRVVRVHPASGEVVATDITEALLERGVDVALATATALAASTARATPGPACTWCERRDACEPGTAWLRRPDRRSMGLPVGRATGEPSRSQGAAEGGAVEGRAPASRV